MTDQEIERLHQDWLKGHHIEFRKGERHFFAWREGNLQIMCDDGCALKHRVIETTDDLFDAPFASGTVRGLLRASELEWVY